jgi:hypothetical protein
MEWIDQNSGVLGIGIVIGFILCFLCVWALGTYYEQYDNKSDYHDDE